MTSKSHQQFWLWSIITALTVMGGFLIIDSVQNDQTEQTSITHPDGYMINAVYQDYNDEGRLHALLKTPKMTHYPDNDTTQFLSPDVIMYTSQQIPWHITSEHGQSKQGADKVLLWGNVVIHQPNRPGSPETTIKTTQITVYPNEQYAQTKKAVSIKRPGSITNAIGLNANFKTGIFKLLSNSRGHYAPNAQ